jgi:hypothetical protein
MLLPHYSIRTLFLGTAVFALCMLIVSSALKGTGLAIAATALFLFTALFFIAAAGIYLFIRIIGELPFFRDRVTPPMVPGAEQESTEGVIRSSAPTTT